MTSKARQATDSGDVVDAELVGAEVAVPVAEDAEIGAAVERVRNFVAERRFGPATTELITYIAGVCLDDADLNVVITEQLSQKLLGATTPDDILAPFEPDKGARFYGVPLVVTRVSFIESEYEGFPWYVVLDYMIPGRGESGSLTVGGERLVMQAAALDRIGAWPQPLMIHRSDKETRAGFRPLELRLPV